MRSRGPINRSLCALFLCAFALAPAPARELTPMQGTSQRAAQSPAIVIGFLGGYVNRNNPVHAEVQLAVRLRKTYPSGVVVETFESRHIKEAHENILSILAGHQKRPLTAEQKQSARIILYGHSWGAASAIDLARELQKDGVQVLLTVQVDSITKVGQNDLKVPANVAQAVNFYQPHGILHGDHDIVAVDPSHTKIIGNFLYDYSNSKLKCSRYPWWDRYVVKAHTQIECDPVVWNKVDSMIRAALPPAEQPAPK